MRCSICGNPSCDLTEETHEVPLTCDCMDDECNVCQYDGDEPLTTNETVFYCPNCHATRVVAKDHEETIDDADEAAKAEALLGR